MWATSPQTTLDYLTHPLSFELFEVKANHLLVPVNVLIELLILFESFLLP